MQHFLGVILLCAVAANASAAQSLYVQSLRGNLLAQPSFSAARVIAVQRGDQLQMLKSQGAWYQVAYSGKQGWMPKLLLGDQPPMNKISVFTGNNKTLEHRARTRASNVTTAGAARGLSADDRRRVGEEKGFNFSAVDRMEALKISDAEALRFIEGGLQQ